MPVRTKVHEDLKAKHKQLLTDHAQLVKDHDELKQQFAQSIALHQEVVEERNQVGKLLLDCLAWMQSVSVTTKQRGGSALIAERSTLVEQAKELGWLPRQEEAKEESKP
jgi:hypothetical protein